MIPAAFAEDARRQVSAALVECGWTTAGGRRAWTHARYPFSATLTAAGRLEAEQRHAGSRRIPATVCWDVDQLTLDLEQAK